VPSCKTQSDIRIVEVVSTFAEESLEILRTVENDDDLIVALGELLTIDNGSERVKRAEASLAKLGRLGIVLPDGVEKGEGRRLALQRKHSPWPVCVVIAIHFSCRFFKKDPSLAF